MDHMEEDFSARFISSVVKSIQTTCHGYLDFIHSIRIQGHIIITVDNQAGKNYILNELILKDMEESSTMFHSGSFQADPPPKSRKTNKKVDMMNSFHNYQNLTSFLHTSSYENAHPGDCIAVNEQSFDAPSSAPSPRVKLEKFAHKQRRQSVNSQASSFLESKPGSHTSDMKMTLRRGGDDLWSSSSTSKDFVGATRSYVVSPEGDEGERPGQESTSSRYFQPGTSAAERLEVQELPRQSVHALYEAGDGSAMVAVHASRQGSGSIVVDNVVSLADSSPPMVQWQEIKTEHDSAPSGVPSHSLTTAAMVDPQSRNIPSRGSLSVMQLDPGGTEVVHHMEGTGTMEVDKEQQQLEDVSPDSDMPPTLPYTPDAPPNSGDMDLETEAKVEGGADFNQSLPTSSACPKLHKVVNRLHTSKKVGGRDWSRSLGLNPGSERSKHFGAIRLGRHKQSHPQSVKSGSGRKKGKKQTTWRLSMLLLGSKDASCVPTIEEIVELERYGLGRPEKELTDGYSRCLRKLSRQQVNEFVMRSYPKIPLADIGFTLATATKGRKFMPIPELADSTFIEHTVGHGKLYIIPNGDIPPSLPNNPAPNGAEEEMMCMLQLYERGMSA